MRFAGQAEEQAETGASVLQALVIGLVAMFIVLSFHFRSLVEPLIVMLAIPLALTGVIWGHLLMGLDLSMPSLIGFVSLAGIVVDNSILLVAFIGQDRAADRPIAEAARRASLDRFRPIVMTTTTTVAGLVPLLFETSVQAQVLIPLVTSLAFGLVSATLLVLFLVPAVYVILDDLQGFRRTGPSGEPQPRT
ncbi:MAG: efflux RND transporter permease subunit [Geminicoccaceae bacterium]|nr:MAG: efflux RND transporter permease subunit [Geminicoccaceae bacterium]